MEPLYMNENRYSYLVGSRARPATSIYAVKQPEGEFEQHLQDLFLTGQAYLQKEEYTLALNAFQEASALILRTVHPAVPVDPNQIGKYRFPLDPSIVDALIAKTADMLVKSVPETYVFPEALVSATSMLSPEVQRKLEPISDLGLRVTSFHGNVETHINYGLEAARRKDWHGAIDEYQTALAATPQEDLTIQASLLHDLALLHDAAGTRDKAQQFGRKSIALFAQIGIKEGQAQALATTAGIFSRAGNGGTASELAVQLDQIRRTTLLTDIVGRNNSLAESRSLSTINANLTSAAPAGAGTAVRLQREAAASEVLALDPSAPLLMGLKYVAEATPIKSLTIGGLESAVAIKLDAVNARPSTAAFLTTLRDTVDLGLLSGWYSPIQFVAYIPHMYFYVLPMSIGDCYSGMGNLNDARQSYASVLVYPFINKNYEIVKTWTRLAQVCVDAGDQAYRNAKDNVAGFAAASALYELVVRADKTLDPASVLYADPKFADIKTRVTNFLAAPDPVQVNDNPAILTIVLTALARLGQIQRGLNFFGFGLSYAPPFSFEYLQNTARYFAQHASQTEQRYIEYKSMAENEEFRREQLEQQAEVARQSVILEQRGVAEAERGVAVAQAGLGYANQQIASAQAAQNDFDNTRWELLALTTTEAWASAASVGEDKEVHLNAHGSGYYTATDKRRSAVLRDLAYRRTLMSQDLEANRLQRAIDSAEAYEAMATAQVDQANARVDVAKQRVAIAQLQQRQAEENRDFLDMKEFSARLWYELAQQARRLTRRYLDMATEIAFLMERAYNAETGRDLSIIRYDYRSTASGNLMGADLLLADVDSFTFDYLTNTKTKKIPVKKSISLADKHPTQFRRLQTTGSCTFETTFSDFDRDHPGLYLAKIRNVEILLVGLAGSEPIAGSFRNIGVSRFHLSNGSVVERLYPADVLVLSQYEIRGDALAFRFNPNDLRLFENNGIETLWRLDLPLDANDFDFTDILDVQVALYYDGFFDSTLETQIRAALPSAGSASRVFSMKFSSPDELFYLKNKGEAEIVFDSAQFPANQKDRTRTTHTIKLTGRPAIINGLKLRLASDALGGELVLTTDANGEVLDTPAGVPLASLNGKPVLDKWRLTITAADNPVLVNNGALDLSGLDDVMIFFEYKFNYR